MNTHTTEGSISKRPWRRSIHNRKLLPIIGIVIALSALGVFVALASPDYSVEVPDRTQSAQAILADGAIVEYIGDLDETFGSAGSGVFDSFVRMQGNVKKTDYESGYNTDGTREFDTKGGAFTHSILLSEIPTIEIGGLLYWEFFADINDSDSTPLISLDDFELYLTDDPNLTGYDFGSAATEIYDYSDANNGHFILINDVNQGSGRGDLRYLVPQDDFDPGNCDYGNPLCTTYLVLYSVWGGKGDPYGFDGGFEEWKVKKYPILQVSKDVLGSYDTPVSWEITKDFPGSYDLFAGESVDHIYIVSVDPIFGPAENTMVYGTITILGDEDDDVNAAISDKFNSVSATITGCSVPENTGDLAGTYPIAAGATVTCSYELSLGDVDPVDGTNVALATYEVDGVNLAFQGSDDILAGEFVQALTGNPVITVDDTNLDGEDWTASAASTFWEYTKTFTCSSDPADYIDGYDQIIVTNTATIVETGDFDVETVTVDCYAPVVEKGANPYFTRYWEWEIIKDPLGDYDLFAGESVTHDYTVSVNPSYTDNDWGVSGGIRVYNDHPSAVMVLTDLTDDAGGTSAPVTCSSLEIPAGGMIECTYDTGPQDSEDVNPFGPTNVATAVFAGASWTGDAPITFGGPTTEVDPVITVDDDNLTGEDWSADRAYADWTYGKLFTCSSDPADYVDGYDQIIVTNTATIVETGDFDVETVTVDCYAPIVDKNAFTEWFQEFTWTIVKEYDGSYELNIGESVDHDYLVTVDQTVDEYGYRAFGSIDVENPLGSPGSMTVNVADAVNGTVVAVDCDGFGGASLTVASGATGSCDYTVALGGTTSLINTATVTFNEIDFLATEDVIFGDPTIVGYPTVNVDDTNGEAWITSSDAAWAYIRGFTCPTDISLYTNNEYTFTHVNVATIVETGASDDAAVTVTCRIPWEGHTPGYWKNHPEDWVGYIPSDLVVDVFSEAGLYVDPSDTLMDALNYPGGDTLEEKAQILLRAGTAALLNAAHPNVDYPISEAQVISDVNAALASGDTQTMLDLAKDLDEWNNLGADLSS